MQCMSYNALIPTLMVREQTNAKKKNFFNKSLLFFRLSSTNRLPIGFEWIERLQLKRKTRFDSRSNETKEYKNLVFTASLLNVQH